jgi:glycosyltransferase involved in cell wall biosynthesis
VVFAGWRDDVPALLGAFDAFVLTSRREGLGSAIVEALVSGRPVVATRVGGIPELIQSEVNGVLVDPADTDALAAAMLGIAADSDRRCRMGRPRNRMRGCGSARSEWSKRTSLSIDACWDDVRPIPVTITRRPRRIAASYRPGGFVLR